MQDARLVLLVSLVLIGIASGSATAAEKEAATPSAPAPAPPPPAATKPAPSPVGKERIINSIEFEGNRKFKDHVLRERLGFKLGDDLDPFLAEGGRVTIMEMYRKIGYSSVQVTLDRERLAEGNLLYVIEEGPRVQVARVRFEGNDSFRARTLKQVVKLKERRWLLWPTYYTEDSVKEATDRLRIFYYDQGYLDHKITAQTEFSGNGAHVYVVFVVEEGPQYRISEFVFTGQTKYTPEQLRAQLKVKEGEVYRKAKVERDARTLADRYRQQGYVDAEVRQSPKFTPEAEEPLVAVTFTIQEGGQFRIGQVEITGNDLTRDQAIRRILDEYGFTPGELYNAKIAPKQGGGLLEKYVARGVITDQAMIRAVLPAPGGDPNSRDARVDIKETMTGMIRPGIGVSSDSGVIGQLIYEQRNFDITDLPDSLSELLFPWKAWRGGGQLLSVRLEPGTRYSSYSVDFVDPYWNDRPVTFNVQGRLWKWFRESYDENRLTGEFGFTQRRADGWRPSIGFRAENVGVSDLTFDAPQEIREVRGHTQLYGVKFGLGKEVLDDIYDPTSGWRGNASYEGVTGDFTFGLLEGELARYMTIYEDVLGRRTVLTGKLLAGTVAGGEAPPFEKYYAGGAGRYGIRGFEYRGVSRRGLQTNVPFPRRVDPIGSNWVFLAKSELLVPLIGQNFNGLFFLDSGTVDSGSYRLSIGAGIEIKIPQVLGNIPMRFEFGFPLLRSRGDETQVFSFSGGGMF